MSKGESPQLSEREQAMMAAFSEVMRTGIAQAIESALAKQGALAAAKPPMSSEELFEKMMGELRGAEVDPVALKLIEIVPGCVSDFTGATFDAEVQWTPVRLNGRVVGRAPGEGRVTAMLNYREPEGADRHAKDGGLVPDGMKMRENYGNGDEIADDFKQWRWESFWQADLRRFVGRPLPAHVRAAAKPIAAAV